MVTFRDTLKATLTGQHADHQPGTPILSAEDITVKYNGHLALDSITFELRAGEQVAVVGPNGAGKSTLIKTIAGIQPPNGGKISVYGHGPEGHICIAYVPQRSAVDWNFPVTVSDVVLMGRIGMLGLFRHPGKRDYAYVRECLDRVGITDLAKRQIDQLSGGQQQRMFIARALAQQAELMLMDEPLTGLDLPAQEGIFEVLNKLREHNVTVVLTTHDLNQAAEFFDRAMLLNQKLLGFGPPNEVFTPLLLKAAYGGQMRLLAADEGVFAFSDTCCDGDLHGGHHHV
ncbi:MAG: metal ABC transporter ATP-binding protein [Anaerolineae bacterium]|nr:metal ABC transporter ATP-binding protein [Anaerolineae bacterium]